MSAKEEIIKKVEEENKKNVCNSDNTENQAENNTEKSNEYSTKRIRIFGITLWRIMAYFIIYSVVGFVIETIFGAVTKGVIESRQSFLYGPFCSIYGLGACAMIICLQKFKKSYNRLFLGGFIVGSIVEYSVSFFGEMMLHVKWWDYSSLPFNINGRICVAFSVFWGILAMYLLGSFNPKVDKLIDKMKKKIKSEYIMKVTILFIMFFMFFDCVISGVAIRFFEIRKIEEYNLNVENREDISKRYNKIYNNSKNLSKFIYQFWNDKKMIRTFPNLKIEDKNGNIIYFDTLVPDVKPYYYKIYDKK